MSHIPLPAGMPGPMAVFAVRPEVGAAMTNLMMTLRRANSSLSPGERELIGAAVSAYNGTEFCRRATSAIATELLGGDQARVAATVAGGPDAEPDPKMRALIAIAIAVAKSPQGVTPALVAAARAAGADDLALHDTVAYAATLCMFNRFIDGLGCGVLDSDQAYAELGRAITAQI